MTNYMCDMCKEIFTIHSDYTPYKKDGLPICEDCHCTYVMGLIEGQPLETRKLELTKEQWQDMIDCCMWGINRAIEAWIEEGRAKNAREAFEKAQFIIDFMHSDWWVDNK